MIVEVRDIWPLSLTEYGKFSPKNPLIWILNKIEQTAYRFADDVVGTMPNLSEHISKFNRQVDIHCIPIGFMSKAHYFANQFKEWPTDLQELSGKFVVGYFGKISRSSSMERILRVMEVLQEHTNIVALIVGDGDLKQELQRSYSSLKNVVWYRKISREECWNLEGLCDLLIFSTGSDEVFKYGQSLNKVAEYMSVGRPILGLYCGFQSMINEAGCGKFICSNDIDKIASEIKIFSEMTKNQLNEMGESGRLWLKANHSYELLARRYLAIIHKSLNE